MTVLLESPIVGSSGRQIFLAFARDQHGDHRVSPHDSRREPDGSFNVVCYRWRQSNLAFMIANALIALELAAESALRVRDISDGSIRSRARPVGHIPRWYRVDFATYHLVTKARPFMLLPLLVALFATEPEPRILWTVPLKSPCFGGGAAADVDGDGVLDIAFCAYFNDSKVRVLRGTDGHEIWSYEAGSGEGKGDACLDASCRFYDIDRDGTLELIVPVSNTSQVIAFDAASGAKKWTYEAGHGECIDTPPWIGPFDGTPDGKLAIVVGTFKAKLHVIDAATGTLLRHVQIAEQGAVQSCPLVLDLNGDSIADYIAATFNGDKNIVAADGAAKEEASAYTADRKPMGVKVQALWKVTPGGGMYHGPSMGDLDADGKPDFAIGAYDGKVYAFKADGSELWTASPGERYIMGPTVVADLDADGKPEVIAASEKVSVLNADGSVRWSVRFDKPGAYWAVTRGASVADLTGDGKPDLAMLNGRGLLKVLSAANGSTLFEFDAATVFRGKMESCSNAPIIADFNGDGKLDIFFVVGRADMRTSKENAGLAICLTGFAGSATNAEGSPAGWFMHKHDSLNTGNTATPIDTAILGLKRK